VDQLQRVGLQDALDLVAGVDGPGAGSVELDVGLPVFQGPAGLADFFVGEGKVVVRVSVSGRELHRHFVGLNAFLHASGFVEDVAQVEISKSVAGIGFEGGAVVFFCEHEILAVVVERSEVDVRGGVSRLELKSFLISRQRFGLRGGIFFERDAAGEPAGGFVLAGSGFGRWDGSAGNDFFARSEVHYKLPGDGLEQAPFMTESNSMMFGGGGSSGFDQRVTHAGSLLLHGLERFADDGRAHAHGAEVADFLDFQQVGKRISGAGRDEPGALPVGKLARREMKNSK